MQAADDVDVCVDMVEWGTVEMNDEGRGSGESTGLPTRELMWSCCLFECVCLCGQISQQGGGAVMPDNEGVLTEL